MNNCKPNNLRLCLGWLVQDGLWVYGEVAPSLSDHKSSCQGPFLRRITNQFRLERPPRAQRDFVLSSRSAKALIHPFLPSLSCFTLSFFPTTFSPSSAFSYSSILFGSDIDRRISTICYVFHSFLVFVAFFAILLSLLSRNRCPLLQQRHFRLFPAFSTFPDLRLSFHCILCLHKL